MDKAVIANVLNEQLAAAQAVKEKAVTDIATLETALSVLDGSHIKMYSLGSDDETAKMLARASFVVMATDDERHGIWERYADESQKSQHKMQWVSDGGGPMETVGTILGRPIALALLGVTIENTYVVFANPTSQLVDYALIDKWLDKHFGKTYDHHRRAVIDAGNFHNVAHAVVDARESA